MDRHEEKLLAKLKRLELKRLEEQMRLAAAAESEEAGEKGGTNDVNADALNVSISDGEAEVEGGGSQLRADASTAEVVSPSGNSSLALLPPYPPLYPDDGDNAPPLSLRKAAKTPHSTELKAKIAAIRR